MKRWKHVKWTEAAQITDILGWPSEPVAAAAPETFFDALRKDSRDYEAIMFLGQALPRFEAVSWATRSVRDLAKPDQTPPDAVEALKTALLWLQDPSDNRRRAAFEAASKTKDSSPERLCALAVFFSGGSLVADNLQPVLPPKDVLGSLAAAAVLAAAAASDDRQQALDKALQLGDALASGSPPPAP